MGSARMTAADTAGANQNDLGPQFGFVIPVKAARKHFGDHWPGCPDPDGCDLVCWADADAPALTGPTVQIRCRYNTAAVRWQEAKYWLIDRKERAERIMMNHWFPPVPVRSA
jgi:hypothetical protein